MSITRNQLKDIVKECLVEILSEGIGGTLVNESPAPRKTQVLQKTKQASSAQNPALDAISYGKPTAQKQAKISQRASNTINESIRAITADPVMSQILSDTATTTLQEQIQADNSHGRLMSSDNVSPGEDISSINIFSDGAKNWAALAFSDAPKVR